MSFGNQNQKDSVSLTPGGVNPNDIATAQKGIPVPYLAGEGAPPVIWLCDPFAPDLIELPATPARGKGAGKSGQPSGSGRYNAYGSIAGLLCHGPIDEINFAELDQHRYWSGSYALGSVNPAPLSVPSVGNYRIMIGSTDQPDWGLPNVSWSSIPHPRYNGFAGFIADHILFGEGRGAPPSHRFGLRRRPRQSLITGPAAALDDGQANWFCILAEWLTSARCGLGLPNSLFNQAAWQAAADVAYANRALTYVSVMLSSRQQVYSLAAEAFAMCDGGWRVDRETGGAEVFIWPPAETINPSTLPISTYRGLVSPPALDAETMEDVFSHFICNYTDRDLNFQVNSVSHNDPGAEGGTNQDRLENISRPYIMRRAQAKAYLQQYARRRAIPGMAGTLPDRQQIPGNLRPGDRLRADIELQPGGLELEQVFRINSVTRPYSGVPQMQVAAERTLVPVPFTPGEAPPPQEEVTVVDIEHAAFFELPPQLSDGGEYALGVLTERPHTLVTECGVYYDPANDTSATFPQLGSHRSFALRAELSASATDTAATIALSLLSPLSREIIASDPGPVAARNNELLLIIIHAPADGRTVFEICSIDALVATGDDAITATVLRGRCGTAPVAHDSATEAWMISRESLSWYRHNDFPTRGANGRTCYLRLQPSTDTAARPLEDCAARPFVFDSLRAFAPVITVTTPATTSVGVEVNQALACIGTVTDADANLVSVTIMRVQGAGTLETVILDRTFSPTALFTWNIPAIGFGIEGTAAIVIRAQDSTRRTIEKRINVVVGAAGSGGELDTDKISPPELLFSNLYASPADIPLDRFWEVITATGTYNPIDVWPAGAVYVWAMIRSSTIATLTPDRVSDYTGDGAFIPADEGGVTPSGQPLIEHLLAYSSIGAASPETDWIVLQGDARYFRDDNEGNVLYNLYRMVRNWPAGADTRGEGGPGPGGPGNALGNYVYGPGYYQYGGFFPRVEAGVRVWAKAHDKRGILADSEIVYFDLYF